LLVKASLESGLVYTRESV